MSTPPYVRLANDIAAQFHHLPQADGVAAISAHLRNFWDPRMRRQLAVYVDAGGDGLDPLAVAAVALLRQPAE